MELTVGDHAEVRRSTIVVINCIGDRAIWSDLLRSVLTLRSVGRVEGGRTTFAIFASFRFVITLARSRRKGCSRILLDNDTDLFLPHVHIEHLRVLV